MKISLIVTDASPLITLAIAESLDTLLMLDVRVIIPDMVNFEVTRHIDKPGSKELLDWIKSHQFNDVFIGSTEVFSEYIMLHEINPSIKSKNRGEQAAAEILKSEIDNKTEAAILLFEDSDIKKANFLIRLPSNVLIMSTSTFLEGLQQKKLIVSADKILQRAVKIRGEGILKRIKIPMSDVEDISGSWPSNF